MNEPEDVPQEWCDADDTLADMAVEQVPAGSQQWLARQRSVHGLLRALHTADAGGREARVQNLLESIDALPVRAPVGGRRHWLLVAAAALLLTTLGIYTLLPPGLPTAEAAVGRALERLARDVDLRYRLVLKGSDAKGQEQIHHEFDLVTRPGKRFLVDGKLSFGNMQLGDFRLGSDGEELWLQSANGMMRRASPLAERERLLQGMGDMLDLGYLDLHDLVRRLPDDFELRVVDVHLDADGRRQLRIEARRERGGRQPLLRNAWLLCDEASGMVVGLGVEVQAPRGHSRSLRFDFVGEEPAGSVDYRRPW